MVMKTKKKLSTFFALILCSVMLTGFMPAAVFADESAPMQAAGQETLGTESPELQNEKPAGAGTSAPAKVEGQENKASEEVQEVGDGAPGKIFRAEASAPDGAADEDSSAEETNVQGTTDGEGASSDTVIPAVRMAQKAVRAIDGAGAEATEPGEAEEEPAENISNETFAEYSAAQWDYKKSIRASQLNDQFETDVTLTLPSAEVKLASEVCFVLDKSSFSKTEKKAMDLLTALKDVAENTGARVQVDIIEFNRTGHNHGSYDLATQYGEIKEEFTQQNSGGTNLHAGLLAAKEVLASNTEIPDSRKYMILVSDGDTYLYCMNGNYSVPYSRSFIPVEEAKGTAYGGFYDESYYYPSAPRKPNDLYGNNVRRPETSDQSSWDAYLDDVGKRNEESITENDGKAPDFEWKYYDDWMSREPGPDEFKTMKSVPRTASNMDMAFKYAADTYHELASRYHCYSVAVQSLNQSDGGHPAFMEYLNGNAVADFDSIKNQILYMLGNGSTIEDYIGFADNDYDFDLKKPEDMTIVVSNGEGQEQILAAEKITDNRFGFGKKDDSTYRFEVTYVPGEKKADEHFIWKTNENITNFERIRLNYRLTLVNPKSSAGTYGEYDEFGEQHKEALRVTTNTVLRPEDSNGKEEHAEEFLLPTVSYTVNESGAPEAKPEAEPKTTPAGYGTVHFYKVDGQTGAKLPGAEFSLYKCNGEYVGSYTTDQNGGITVYNILHGSYYFTETKAPDGYTLDPTYVKFTLDSSEMNVKFSNTAATVPTMLVGGIKTWNDNNNAAGARPASITLHLFANGVEVGTTQATADTNWQYTFGVQPVNGTDGKAIVYSLSEDSVRNYTTAIAAPVTTENAMVINVTNTYKTAAIQSAGIATGDDSHMALYGMISLITGVGVVGLFIRKKIF